MVGERPDVGALRLRRAHRRPNDPERGQTTRESGREPDESSKSGCSTDTAIAAIGSKSRILNSLLDNREYGSSVKDETSASFSRIQAQSERKHRALNDSVLRLAAESGAVLPSLTLENSLVPGLQTDATFREPGRPTVALEFHHKAASESTNNKLAIYVLEKLKEYAINYGLASR